MVFGSHVRFCSGSLGVFYWLLVYLFVSVWGCFLRVGWFIGIPLLFSFVSEVCRGSQCRLVVLNCVLLRGVVWRFGVVLLGLNLRYLKYELFQMVCFQFGLFMCLSATCI